MTCKEIRHRDNLGPKYRGVAIHALPGLHELANELAKELFSAPDVVLELGAGSGALSLRLTDSGFTVLPVDLDGSDWIPNAPILEANLNEPNWQDKLPAASYKQIIALELIEHLENPSKFFRDISELLADDGILILSTPNVLSFYSVHAAFKRGELSLFSPRDCVESGHISILPWWLLEHLGQQAGLSVIRCKSVCEVPMSVIKRILHRVAISVRSLVFASPVGVRHEGLNVVMVFRKHSRGTQDV
jgi:SAM-dependent methyltransferase